MELNSPRKNPYSDSSRAEESLRKAGYDDWMTILDEETGRLEKNGKTYSPQQLQIDRIVRLEEKEVFMSDERKSRPPEAFYALQTNDGNKAIITEKRNDEGSEVVEAFLRRIDRSDELREDYTA